MAVWSLNLLHNIEIGTYSPPQKKERKRKKNFLAIFVFSRIARKVDLDKSLKWWNIFVPFEWLCLKWYFLAWSRFTSPRSNSSDCPMFRPFQDLSPLNWSVELLSEDISIIVQSHCAVRIGDSGLNCPFCVRFEALHRARFSPSKSASCQQHISFQGFIKIQKNWSRMWDSMFRSAGGGGGSNAAP